MLLSAENLKINYGLRQILDDVSIYLNRGDKVGVIGINGTGKSTLLRIAAGVEIPDEGKVSLDPNVQISYLAQNPIMNDENDLLQQIFEDMPAQFRAAGEFEAKTILTKLGFTVFDKKVGELSGGQRKRLALAGAILHPADILVLDEPTNHLDTEMISWLEQFLKKFTGAVLMVTHDRYFLERVANRIVEVDKAKLYFYEANYSKYLELKTARAEMAQASERKRLSILRVEREWIMRGAQARRTKNKDRIANYEALLEQAPPETDSSVSMIAASSRLGRKTIECENVSKSYGDHKVISNFSYSLLRDARVGIVGRNGAGKTTLLDIICGVIPPDSGNVEMGATVKIGYFSQEGRELDPNQRVYDFIHEISSELRTSKGVVSAKEMMENFLFPTQLQGQNIGKLSGGEKRRLYLLSILMQCPNILVLDEPTNDLDTTTLAVLEDYLDSFSGAVIAVSHDRYFLDRMATEILEVCETGTVRRFSGNYADYLEKSQDAEQKPKKEKAAVRENRPDRPQKLKFSFKEQREFETIDDDIAQLEDKIAECEKLTQEFSSDYVKLQEIDERRSLLEAELEEKIERWAYLSDLAERIAAQK